LGLAFKPNTDDIREAKSFEIINLLAAEGAKIKAYDPVAMENAKKLCLMSIIAPVPMKLPRTVTLLVIVTEWNEFRLLNLEKLKSIMRKPFIFDAGNMYNPKQMEKMGFHYYSIGR